MRPGDRLHGWEILLRPAPDAPLPLVAAGRLEATDAIRPFLPRDLGRDEATLVPLHVGQDAWLLAEGRYSEGIAGMRALAARPEGSVRPGDPRFYRRAGIALAIRAADGLLFARRAKTLHTNPGLWCVAAGEGMTAEDLGHDVRRAARRAALEEWDLDLPEAAFRLLALARHHRFADCAAFLLAETPEDAATLEARGAAAHDAWEREAILRTPPGRAREALEAAAAADGAPPTPAGRLMADLLDAGPDACGRADG